MELYQLCSILEKLSKVDDVRKYLKQFISNNKVNFAKAAKILSGGRVGERASSEPPSESVHKEIAPSPTDLNSKPNQRYTKDDSNAHTNLLTKDETKEGDRNKSPVNIMMNTWTPNNKYIEEQFKKFTMMNQYKTNGVSNPDHENKKSGSRKHSRTRQHSANPKMHHSKQRKSPNRGRNDNSFNFNPNKYENQNTMFLNMIKNSLKGGKSKHKKIDSSMNASRGRDKTIINSILTQTMSNVGRNSVKKSKSRKSRASNTPKRGIKHSKTLGRGKGGSTRVSRKGSTANSNERGAYKTYVSQRVSPKSKINKASIDYNPSSSSFKFSNMIKDMGISFNYNNYQQNRVGVRSRQGVIGSKKSSMIDSLIGNANKARERAQKMYSATNIHTPTPSNDGPFYNDSKLGSSDVLMMNSNNNHHQHTYKLTSTGRGKTPHQKPGVPKKRKNSGSNKRSSSRPRSSKNPGVTKVTPFPAKFFTQANAKWI
jgi:hypothetical protein